MRSGLWILLLVIVAGIAVGSMLKDRLVPPEHPSDLTALRTISQIEDPEDRIDRLEQFITDYPGSEYKPDAYYMIAGTILEDLGDTTRMIAFAKMTLEEAADSETRALMYYRLYRATAETRPQEAYKYARQLYAADIDVGWVQNYIAFDLAEKGEHLDLSLSLADRALAYAEDAGDSASYLDTRGWAYYRKGDYDRALADLEEAAEISPEPSDEILSHLGDALLKTGRTEEAFETFRSVLLLGEYQEARDRIEFLMDRMNYTDKEREAFESSLWEERLARAPIVEPFTLPALGGGRHEYQPGASAVSVINFFSPT
jgi:tetratricopeptide (TPR) repeat protein